MNEQFQKVLIDVMAVLNDAAQWSAAVAKQELPLLVQEYLRWGMVKEVVWFLVFTALAVGALRVGKYLREYEYPKSPVLDYYGKPTGEMKYADSCYTGKVFGNIIFRVFALVLGLFALWPLMNALKIYIAPRVYLLEQVSGLI